MRWDRGMLVLGFWMVGWIALGGEAWGQVDGDAGKSAAVDVLSDDRIKEMVTQVRYKTVEDVQLNLHLFYPEGHHASDRRPAIVFFFGGGWVSGTPKQFYRHAAYLSRRGMVAACAEYRIKSKHDTSPRECVMDGKSAIRFLRSRAGEFGIDPQQIIAGGGSAGGHVAAATATVTAFDQPGEDTSVSPRPVALVLFNPVLDNGPEGWGHARVKDYWRQISPMHNLTRPTVPTLFMLGSEDKLLPVDVARRFEKQVETLGGRCDVIVAADKGHGYFNRGQSFVDTLEATDRFLASLGYLEGPPQVNTWFDSTEERSSADRGPSTSR